MKERCDLLTKQFDKPFIYAVYDLHDNLGNASGTRVEIRAPLLVNHQNNIQ